MEEKEMIQEASNHLVTLETEIRIAYTEANEFSLRAKETAREAVLRMADCGQLILLAKEHVRGNRQAWLASLGIRRMILSEPPHQITHGSRLLVNFRGQLRN